MVAIYILPENNSHPCPWSFKPGAPYPVAELYMPARGFSFIFVAGQCCSRISGWAATWAMNEPGTLLSHGKQCGDGACLLAKWKCSTRVSAVPCLPGQWVGIMSLEWVGENDKLMAKENSCLRVISYISCTWLSGMVNFGAYSQVQRISTSLVKSLGRP